MITNVTVSTRNVGAAFGTQGIIRTARHGKAILLVMPARPYGFTLPALNDAVAECGRRGWTIVDSAG